MSFRVEEFMNGWWCSFRCLRHREKCKRYGYLLWSRELLVIILPSTEHYPSRTMKRRWRPSWCISNSLELCSRDVCSGNRATASARSNWRAARCDFSHVYKYFAFTMGQPACSVDYIKLITLEKMLNEWAKIIICRGLILLLFRVNGVMGPLPLPSVCFIYICGNGYCNVNTGKTNDCCGI